MSLSDGLVVGSEGEAWALPTDPPEDDEPWWGPDLDRPEAARDG
jgi:hypothetical protein